MRRQYCSSPDSHTCRLPTTGPNVTWEWARSNRRCRGASGQESTPRPIAASPVTCRPWQIRDTIRWSPFKWPFRDSSMLIGVSSYTARTAHLRWHQTCPSISPMSWNSRRKSAQGQVGKTGVDSWALTIQVAGKDGTESAAGAAGECHRRQDAQVFQPVRHFTGGALRYQQGAPHQYFRPPADVFPADREVLRFQGLGAGYGRILRRVRQGGKGVQRRPGNPEEGSWEYAGNQWGAGQGADRLEHLQNQFQYPWRKIHSIPRDAFTRQYPETDGSHHGDVCGYLLKISHLFLHQFHQGIDAKMAVGREVFVQL